ncbi:hypothetical protein V8F20_005144 [Naviculisporaceae sp. PSN 640]
MDSRGQDNKNPAPAIVLTLDSADEDGEDGLGGSPRLDMPRPAPRHIVLDYGHLNPGDLPRTSCDSISLASAATIDSDSRTLASYAASSVSRPSVDDDGMFEVSPGTLGELMNARCLKKLDELGGIDGIADRLMSHRTRGLNSHGLSTPYGQSPQFDAARRLVFGSNKMPERKVRTIWGCAQEPLQEPVLWLLLGPSCWIFVTHLFDHNGDNWIDAFSSTLAAAVAVTVSIAATYVLDRKFTRMLSMTSDRQVKAIRGGSLTIISSHEIMVGDIITLEQGDLVPADGLLVSGNNIKCDESCNTGESKLVAKSGPPPERESSSDALDLNRKDYDPFIISGSRVMEGSAGRCLVTGVGVNSIYGRRLQDVREAQTAEQTPLRQRADKLVKRGARWIMVYVAVIAIIFLAHGISSFQEVQKILTFAATIMLVSVPEGLPMSVLVALISAGYGMYRERNLVRKLSSCETMGNATAICCDKTGTLTMNEMSVTEAMIGNTRVTGLSPESLAGNTWKLVTTPASWLGKRRHVNDAGRSVSPESNPRPWEAICPQVAELFVKSLIINSTAVEVEQNGVTTFIGSGTETALLRIADSRVGPDLVRKIREDTPKVQSFPFDSNKKCMGTVTRLSSDKYRVYIKGAPEILLARCDRTIDDPGSPLECPMTPTSRSSFLNAVEEYGSRSLRTLGFAYRDFDSWPPCPPGGSGSSLEDQDLFQHVSQNLVLLGLVGIQDPLRPGVRDAVSQCQRAGLTVRLLTGDNMTTAVAVATSCGILDGPNLPDSVWEGSEFRELSPQRMKRVLPRVRVVARCTPEDKKLIVAKSKAGGETVAVTGDGTNDGPALRAADVGYAMGISGTEVAKEASSIVLLDDNFASIVKAIARGRGVYDAVRRFLQFQLAANISVLAHTAVSAINEGVLENRTLFTTPQLLWLNLIMDILGAVALSTGGPDRDILKRRPERKDAPLLTIANWKMTIGQAVYQLLVVLILDLGGRNLIEWIDPSADKDVALLTKTMVFNTYICMQFFNLFNSRRPNNKINILKDITRNKWFMGSSLCIIVPQVLLVSFGGKLIHVTRLNMAGWAISLGLGFLTIPLGMAIRCIPDEILTSGARRTRVRVVRMKASFSSLFTSPPSSAPSTPNGALDRTYDEESPLMPDERAALLGYDTLEV